ncbi:MAG: DUF4349 domain-containing protein [Chitinophagaceae bacterium]
MKYFKLTTVIAVLTLLFSCRNKEMSAQNEIDKKSITQLDHGELKENEVNNNFYSDSIGTPQAPDPRKKSQQASQPEIKQDWDKKIIKTASLNLEVKDYKDYYLSLREKVRNLGGYIAQEEQNQSDYKIENTLSIKVPVDQFDNAVTQLSANIEKLNEKKITSEDVTGEFIDTKSRMEAKKHVRERYLGLLNQAKNMEEILSVQSEINGIQEQIESGLGRVEYLSHASAFSTINLTYYQVVNSSAKDNDKPSFAARFGNAFRTGWDGVAGFFVGLVSIWPLILLIFSGIFIYKKVKLQKLKQA